MAISLYQPNLPPPKFVFSGAELQVARRGVGFDCLPRSDHQRWACQPLCDQPWCAHNSYSDIYESILFDDVEVGAHCRIRRAIIDKGSVSPRGTEIGYDLEADRRRGWTVTECGLVVIARGEHIQSKRRFSCAARQSHLSRTRCGIGMWASRHWRCSRVLRGKSDRHFHDSDQ